MWTGIETRFRGVKNQELLFTPVIYDSTKSTSFNYLCKCKCFYLLKNTPGNVCKKKEHFEPKTVRSLSLFCCLLSAKRKKRITKNLHTSRCLISARSTTIALRFFIFSHEKATKLQRNHLSSKRIPQQTRGRVDKWNWQPRANLPVWIYGSLPVPGPSGWEGGGWEDHAPLTFLPFLLRYGVNKSRGWGQNSQPIKWFMGPAAHSPRTMYFITVNLRTRYNFLSQGAAFKSGHLDSPAAYRTMGLSPTTASPRWPCCFHPNTTFREPPSAAVTVVTTPCRQHTDIILFFSHSSPPKK